MAVRFSAPLSQFWTFSIALSFIIQREREKKKNVGRGSERHYRFGDGCN
jgi:hypothetical protein